MNVIRFSHARLSAIKLSLMFACVAGAAVSAQAQNLVQADGENVQQRITRARALAAVGNLPAARSELESLSHAQSDESVREIALVLLVGVYLEQADYSYAETLLNQTFTARQTQRDTATHAYFALAGQVINGVRAHVERYRALGLDVTDSALPPEATGDLEHLRTLLERVIAQGKQLSGEGGQALDATALVEEAAVVRARLARNSNERAQWQREVTGARQRLATTGTRQMISSNRSAPTQPDPNTSAAPAPTPTPTPVQPAPTPTPTSVNSNPQSAPAATPPGQQPAANTSDSANAGATAAQPLDVGGTLITKAREKIAPSYPAQARSARITGSVTVFLMVDERGMVAEVQRTNGPELLRRAAEDAARRWKFRPTVVNGQPIRVSGYINFNFAL